MVGSILRMHSIRFAACKSPLGSPTEKKILCPITSSTASCRVVCCPSMTSSGSNALPTGWFIDSSSGCFGQKGTARQTIKYGYTGNCVGKASRRWEYNDWRFPAICLKMLANPHFPSLVRRVLAGCFSRMFWWSVLAGCFVSIGNRGYTPQDR